MATNYKINISDEPSNSSGFGDDNCRCTASLNDDVISSVSRAIEDELQRIVDEAEAIEAEEIREEMRETVNLLAEAVADLSATARLVSELVDEVYTYEA